MNSTPLTNNSEIIPKVDGRRRLLIGASVVGTILLIVIVVPTAIVFSKDKTSTANITPQTHSIAPITTAPISTPPNVLSPTVAPSNKQNDHILSESPSASASPSKLPTAFPTQKPVPTYDPSEAPSLAPTLPVPSNEPSEIPSIAPTYAPTNIPTELPSELPSEKPSTNPSASPSQSPTATLSSKPSMVPSDKPSISTNPTYEPGELMILAYYYPWYYRDDWSRHGYQDEPLLGKYGTDEPAVAEQHNEWAERAGIDAWVVSYNSESALTTQHFQAGMLNASNIDKMKFCMLYETLMALPTYNFADGTTALDSVIGSMIHIRDTYFDHPSYLKINGRPVVCLYVTRRWENFEPYMLDIMKEVIGVDVFFIADEPFYGWQKNVDEAWNGVKNGKPVFEAYTTYNMYTDPTARAGESAKDFMFREALPIFEHWSENTIFFPNVLPMYYDFRGHPPLVGDAAGFREQLDKFACLPRPSWYEGGYPNMMFVTSWNEWWEGSQIEPDKALTYGFTFIDELKRFKDAGLQCPEK